MLAQSVRADAYDSHACRSSKIQGGGDIANGHAFYLPVVAAGTPSYRDFCDPSYNGFMSPPHS